MKSIICLCLFALVAINATQYDLNDKARQYLAHVKMTDLPESVRLSLAKEEGRGAGDASHWCCINEQPITTVTETKIEHATRVVATKTKVGYVSCGFAGTMRCSHYVTNYRQEIYTYIQTFQVPNMAACNSHEVKCCSGYLLVAENCHTYADIMENRPLFEFLSQLGLLSTGIGK
ncbi:unnamed protein product [Adineta ricciae]|uniref:Uncharacterized protein n=1 Tax=Adineta ricciae TaxID=249248 RepID=A0A816CZB3_ADIRI|nr:unnamed protein product [Adineta ricciae]